MEPRLLVAVYCGNAGIGHCVNSKGVLYQDKVTLPLLRAPLLFPVLFNPLHWTPGTWLLVKTNRGPLSLQCAPIKIKTNTSLILIRAFESFEGSIKPKNWDEFFF
jgi:hypothetical protein